RIILQNGRRRPGVAISPSPPVPTNPFPRCCELLWISQRPLRKRMWLGPRLRVESAATCAARGRSSIPNASVVRGRIRRLEHYQGGGYFILGLEFTEVEANGRSLRFYA